MKANELMAGDLVQYNGIVCRVYGLELPSPRKNERFNNKAIIHLWHNGFIDALEEDVFPIPLTAEILEKIFPTPEIVAWWYADDYEDADDRITYEIHISGGGLGINGFIWYVHELQHALRLCGLNEMADNFKI